MQESCREALQTAASCINEVCIMSIGCHVDHF